MTTVNLIILDYFIRVDIEYLKPVRPHLITLRACHIMDGGYYCYLLLVIIRIGVLQ
jgi:hypothetical protein